MIRASMSSDVLRCPAPVELKQDRVPAIDRDLSQHVAVEQVSAHDPKGLLEFCPVESLAAGHGPPVSVAVAAF